MINWNERGLRLLVGDDWEAIVYKDEDGEDIVLAEGHQLDAEDVLFALGFRFDIEDIEDCGEDWDYNEDCGFDPYMGCYSDDC